MKFEECDSFLLKKADFGKLYLEKYMESLSEAVCCAVTSKVLLSGVF